LAKADPQWPQAFYRMNKTIEIESGDALVARCTYHNSENRTVYAGSTHNDEMCNVYIMFYTERVKDAMTMCYGHSYKSLERSMPEDASVKPEPPASLKYNDYKPAHHHSSADNQQENKKTNDNEKNVPKQNNQDRTKSEYIKEEDEKKDEHIHQKEKEPHKIVRTTADTFTFLLLFLAVPIFITVIAGTLVHLRAVYNSRRPENSSKEGFTLLTQDSDNEEDVIANFEQNRASHQQSQSQEAGRP
jgi:hypothetical protein